MERKEELEARFGPNPADWPPPFRGSLAGGDAGHLHAALMVDGDETALTQAVLTRLALPHHAGVWAMVPAFLLPRVALASYAGVWLALAVVGYQGAGGFAGDPMLALALGDVQGQVLGLEALP